jgi:signal transduction histidine kinase/ligand-binding sensor domain-containing protein
MATFRCRYNRARETLRNAFRHAQARQIEVELRYYEAQFRLRIRDDWKGIGPKILDGDGHAGHFGLPGMRERAKLIGGCLRDVTPPQVAVREVLAERDGDEVMSAHSSSAHLMVCRLHWGLLCCCLIASSVPGWSQALGPGLAITQFGHTTWRVAEGALTGKPTSITQTKDGYLWIGTDAGLFRFDGTRFSPWTKWPAGVTTQPSIYFLLGARDGTLWIGSAVLARIRGGELLELGAAAGRANDFVEDRDGTVWFARTRTKGGPLCRLDQDSYQCYGAKEGINCITGQSVSADPEGGIWVGSNSGICDWLHGSSTYHNPTGKQAEAYEMPPVQVSLSLGSGGMLVGYSAKGPHFGLQQLLPDGRWKSFDLPGFHGESLATSSLILDSHGDLWIGTNEQGLYHVSGGKVDHFGAADGLSADDINSLYEDHEGSIWVATSAGIDCFRRLKVASFSLKQGFITNRAVAVAAKSDGTVVVGGRGGLQITKGAAVTQLQFGKDLPGHEIRTLMYDHAGTLWVTSNQVGTVVAGRFVPIPLPDVPQNTLRLMIEDQQHQIWIVGTAGLYQIEAGRLVDTHLVHGPRYSIAPDPKAGFWILTHGGSLQRVVEGTSRTLSGDQDKTAEFFGFRVEPNEDIWAWGKRGLRFWTDSGWRTLDSQAGLSCDVVYTTIDDADGNIWIYQPCGISVVPYAELSRWAQQLTKKISPKFIIDPTDGAFGDYNDFGPDSARSLDGQLWFAHNSPLQMIDTKHLTFNTIPPPVHIEQIVADHKKFEVKGSVALPARTRDLQIDYTALSFITPQRVRFRYKLSGIDKDWQEVGTRRQAFYMNLAPGHYTFQVIACNSDGVWNEEGATLDFRVESAWYQTIWFRISCAGAFCLLLWAAYWLRVRQLAHRFSMTLEARVGERSRIARELHDTLLQSFHGLLLHLQTASSLLPANPAQAKQKLDSTIDQAAQAITEGRDAIQELRSSTIETNDLAVAIRAIGEELSADGTTQNAAVFQVVVEGAPRSLHPILRDEVYRIAAEALRNAFRHAQARQIEVELRYDETQFRLRIRDDGKGIDPKVRDGDGPARHYGLPGMRERAKLVGGKMTVWSEVDSGTEIELSIPAAVAYATSLRRSWLSEKFFRKRTDGTRTGSKETDLKETKPNS